MYKTEIITVKSHMSRKVSRERRKGKLNFEH
ncbi:rCG30426, partial [Rattus norvegicus]